MVSKQRRSKNKSKMIMHGKSILVCCILLAFILLPAAASTSAMASTPEVSVVPAVINTNVGNRFTINVTVSPAGNEIYGAQCTLRFDPSILQVVKQTKGTFLSQDGASTVEVKNSFNNTRGTVEYGETRVGVKNGVEEPGTLTSISFEVVGTGTSDLELLDVIMSDPHAESIKTVVNNGSCVAGGGETSTETPTPTPTPTVTATPTPTSASTHTPTASPAPTPTATATVETPAPTTPSSTTPPADIMQTHTPTSSPTETPKTSIPGFETVLSICALLLVIITKLRMRRG